MALLNPFFKKSDSSESFIDNSNRIARIIYRFGSYRKLFTTSLKKGVPLSDLIRAQFPFVLADSEYPPIVAIELTNYCNLKCPYCTSPLGQRARGYMSDEVFNRIIEDLKEIKPNRIQLIGNGESTIHPKFSEMITRLAKTKCYISVVTNGQWISDKVPYKIIESGLDLVEFSIDAGGKEGYERSRINGDYDKLLKNVILLKKLRDEAGSKMIINIRMMVRPSQKEIYKEEMKFWAQHADRVMPQYLMKINNTDYNEDIFIPVQRQNNDFPKCSMPFKHFEIKWTGEVLMCYYTLFQMGPPGLVLGNVAKTSLKELWNSEIMRQYRAAHRNRNTEKMPACKGCPGT